MKTDPWFMSEDGIRGHYAEQRETEARLYEERMKRLNDEENAFLDAFRTRTGGGA
jgi:hypothetical protein